MNNKLNIRALSLTSFTYFASAVICMATANWLNLPLLFWIPLAISISATLIYGKRVLFGVGVSGIVLLILSFLDINILPINPIKLIALTTSDIIVSIVFANFFKHRIPFLDYTDDLKSFFKISILSSIAQSLVLFATLSLTSQLTEIDTLKGIQLIFTSILSPLIVVVPFILTFYTKPDPINFKNNIFGIIVLIAFSTIPSIIDITFILNNLNLLPIQLLAIIAASSYAIIAKFKRTVFFTLTFSILLILSSLLNRNFFNIFDEPYHLINAQYFVLIISLIVITVSAILKERNNALQSLKDSYISFQSEINQQTNIFRDLNNKLISEVEQRGLIEKELYISKKLLTESQEIANITSWEYDLKLKTIRWSESASRILGINSSQVSEFSMEKYIEKIHPDDRRRFLNAISNASENTIDINLEIRYDLNNYYRHFLIKGRSFDDNTEVERIVGVLSDITDWKEAQVALSEKEIRYRALFENNIDPVILIDGNTLTILDVNVAFEKLYEYSKNEVIGTPYINISAQEYETHQALDITLQKGFYRVPSRLHRKKNGDEFYVEGHFVKFISGQNPQIFAVLRDNTARKNFEFKLSERELKFRLFFESNLIGMAETTIYKSWITFNTKLCQILGYKPDEIEKLTWDKITHPDDVEFEVKQFNNILQRKNDSYTLEKRFIKKDGSIVYCNVAVKAIKDNTGAITHLVKLIEDITLRKKAETALLESQNRLKKAQEIAHLGVCRLNALTGYLDVSEQALEILEWNKESAPFKLERFIQTIHPTDRDIVNASIDRLKSLASEEENLETRIIRSSGEIAYLSLDLGVAIDTNRKITDLIITFADITSSKLAEEALKDANAMKDQLFSVISHDLRGPIGSVEQMLSLYLSSWESMDNESRTEIITLVHNTTKESYNLLENLLEWGRSQRQATIKPIQIEIQGVVSETVQLLSSMASAKNINIGTNISNECKAFVDPMMFKTIIRNLISNAIKFTPNGGRIDLNCSCDHQLCTIQVSDTGVGIPVDRIELIFDDSKVFSTSGTNSEKGTGLGLKLVKRFVDKNGGTITVSNNQNQGTTFTISLPAQESN